MITAHQALKFLAAKMTTLAGAPVEITVRSEKAFTFSLDIGCRRNARRLADFFKAEAGNTVTVVHDDACGSFVYVDAQ